MLLIFICPKTGFLRLRNWFLVVNLQGTSVPLARYEDDTMDAGLSGFRMLPTQ